MPHVVPILWTKIWNQIFCTLLLHVKRLFTQNHKRELTFTMEIKVFTPHPFLLIVFLRFSAFCWLFANLNFVGCNRCFGSVAFWYGSGYWPSDPYLGLLDQAPDPALFVSDLQDRRQQKIFYAYSFLMIQVNHSSKI